MNFELHCFDETVDRTSISGGMGASKATVVLLILSSLTFKFFERGTMLVVIAIVVVAVALDGWEIIAATSDIVVIEAF